ncbi:hypothetical protein [Azotobacter beijerinckii]|uniref:hypothetical protein n=1 Tax=Azotobacter beijerinckii TaxID=170623 RepID=UPI00116079E5|nr:hypothetical protein [Azotobacter beijerinckii]
MAINLATSTCLVLLVLAKQSVLWISGNSSGPNGKVNPESKTNSHKSAESFCHQPVPGNAKPNTPILLQGTKQQTRDLAGLPHAKRTRAKARKA